MTDVAATWAKQITAFASIVHRTELYANDDISYPQAIGRKGNRKWQPKAWNGFMRNFIANEVMKLHSRQSTQERIPY